MRCTTVCGSRTALSSPPRRFRTATSADRFLPDKAIDLVDEAASRLRMQIDSKPEEIDETRSPHHAVEDRAVELWPRKQTAPARIV